MAETKRKFKVIEKKPILPLPQASRELLTDVYDFLGSIGYYLPEKYKKALRNTRTYQHLITSARELERSLGVTHG